MTPAEFSRSYRDGPTFRPDLPFLALGDRKVVPFCLSEVDDADNATQN